MDDEVEGRPSSAALDRSEGFGERLLGSLLDRAHQMPPHLIAPLIEQEIAPSASTPLTIMIGSCLEGRLEAIAGRRGGAADQLETEQSRAADRSHPQEVRVRVPLGHGP